MASVFHACIGRTVSDEDVQAFLSLASSLLTPLSFGSLLITLLHVFLGRPLGKLSQTLKVQHLLDQALPFFLDK